MKRSEFEPGRIAYIDSEWGLKLASSTSIRSSAVTTVRLCPDSAQHCFITGKKGEVRFKLNRLKYKND
jgi:hypothetical protein